MTVEKLTKKDVHLLARAKLKNVKHDETLKELMPRFYT